VQDREATCDSNRKFPILFFPSYSAHPHRPRAMAAPENDDRPAVSESPKAVSEYTTTPISHSHNSSGSQFGILGLHPSDSSPDYDIVHAKPTSQNQLKEDQYQLPAMAPPPRRDLLHKDHFAFVFGSAKTQSYYDPAAKGPGSHT
jgi:hypothetical protein